MEQAREILMSADAPRAPGRGNDLSVGGRIIPDYPMWINPLYLATSTFRVAITIFGPDELIIEAASHRDFLLTLRITGPVSLLEESQGLETTIAGIQVSKLRLKIRKINDQYVLVIGSYSKGEHKFLSIAVCVPFDQLSAAEASEVRTRVKLLERAYRVRSVAERLKSMLLNGDVCNCPRCSSK